ncbi:MAG: phosphatase PAP2 family protein [Candidatus Azobacteroides sp.]|nr:phosphatase PAP2 family protein [Candidatus Azobacteroides sp.]
MLEKELQFERNIFFFLNGSDSALGDNFFYIYTCPWTWIIFYICFLWVFIYKKDWREAVCVLAAVVLLVLLTDQISSGFFKPVFHRFRPTHHPDFLNQVKTVFNYRGGNYGFISGHAANSFGFATFCALIFRNKLFTCTIFLFAFLNAYSRIYIGVHFISDVVIGALVGMLIAWLVWQLYNRVRRRIFSENGRLKKPIYSAGESYFLCGIFYLYLVIILIFNNQIVTILLQNK